MRTFVKNLSQHSRRHGWDSNGEPSDKIPEAYLLGHADDSETMCEISACRDIDYKYDTSGGLP